MRENTDYWVIGIIIGILILVGVGVGIAYSINTKKDQSLTEFTEKDTEKPAIAFDKTEYDFGNLTHESVERIDFMIQNVGTKTLKISDFKTSCGCTSVVVSIDGKKSSTFSMHTVSNWVGEIEPGGEAQIEVTYDAKVHPAEGDIERFIYFKTNDPLNSSPELKIKMNIE